MSKPGAFWNFQIREFSNSRIFETCLWCVGTLWGNCVFLNVRETKIISSRWLQNWDVGESTIICCATALISSSSTFWRFHLGGRSILTHDSRIITRPLVYFTFWWNFILLLRLSEINDWVVYWLHVSMVTSKLYRCAVGRDRHVSQFAGRIENMSRLRFVSRSLSALPAKPDQPSLGSRDRRHPGSKPQAIKHSNRLKWCNSFCCLILHSLRTKRMAFRLCFTRLWRRKVFKAL